MNLLIIGCGRVGANLAGIMCERGHDVAVIDKKKSSFELLDERFTGLTFEGVPIDNDTLLNAGITQCDAVCAVTEDDNVNIMASEIAKNVYKVPLVLTRILDPDKEDVFEEFGLHSVCPTRLTVEAIISAMENDNSEQTLRFDNHMVKFFSMPVPKEFVGLKCTEIQFEENEVLYAILSGSGKFNLVNNYNILLKEGDTLIFSKLVD